MHVFLFDLRSSSTRLAFMPMPGFQLMPFSTQFLWQTPSTSSWPLLLWGNFALHDSWLTISAFPVMTVYLLISCLPFMAVGWLAFTLQTGDWLAFYSLNSWLISFLPFVPVDGLAFYLLDSWLISNQSKRYKANPSTLSYMTVDLLISFPLWQFLGDCTFFQVIRTVVFFPGANYG